jgi:hypothetical protein
MKINTFPFTKLVFFLIVSCSIWSCKRYINEESKELIPEKDTITKLEVDKIVNLKVNLVNYSEANKYSISIPDNYEASTTEYEEGNLNLKYGKLNTETRKGVNVIELKSSLTRMDGLRSEEVSIIKEDNPNLLTIKDVKLDIENEPIYYEDSNSIIYGEDFKVLHFDYDSALKSYVVYVGEVSHFGAIPQQDKLNLAMHILKNAKNILKKDYKNAPFNSWEEYVVNLPIAEINFIKKDYVALEKEMKVFLGLNESIEISDSRTTFYRTSQEMEIAYLQFLDAVKTNKVVDFNISDKIHDDFEDTFVNYDAEDKYSYTQIENVIDLKIKEPDYVNPFEKLICNIDYQGKSFYIISKDFSDMTKDFYIKMFNYYSKNKTLDIQ